VVANHLSMQNIELIKATSGIEALEKIGTGQKPDLILLDVMMPQMTGFEVCRRLRERYTAAELPIIMLTAKNRVADLVEGFESGANDYLVKPFSKDELLSRVWSHLKIKTAYETLEENLKLKTELEAQKLKEETALLRTEMATLEKLRYQLNPHFLFNALASIRGAIVRDRDIAREMLTKLAEFCRLTLARRDRETFSVKEEIEQIRLYLEIESIRLGDYLSVSIDVEPGLEDLPIPPFVLQPLVENALKYGKQTSPETLEIGITVKCRGRDRLMIEVVNSGTWIESVVQKGKTSTGVGLENIRLRLEAMYPDNYTIEKKAEDQYVKVAIEIPG